MYKMLSSVGEGRPNKAPDVAFVQFALKLIRGHYTGPIDGKFSSSLNLAIANFAEDIGTRKKGMAITNKVTIFSAEGLIKLLPPRFSSYVFHILPDGSRIFLANKNGGEDKSPYTHTALTMPNEEAKQLVFFLRHISKIFKIVGKIEQAGTTPAGKVLVKLSFSGGAKINERSGDIVPLSGGIDSRKIIHFIQRLINRNQMNLWDFSSKQNLVLKTVNPLPFAKIRLADSYKMRWVLEWDDWQTAKKNGIVAKCIEIYSEIRLQSDVEPSKKEQLTQCFGNYWKNIEERENVHKFLCAGYLKDLRDLEKERNRIQENLAFNTLSLGEALKRYRGDLITNDEILGAVGDVFSLVLPLAGRALKTAGISKNARAITEFTAGATVSGATKADDVDKVLIGASAIAMIVVLSAGASVVATVFGALVLVASAVKAVSDLFQLFSNVKERSETKEQALREIINIEEHLAKLLEALETNLKNIEGLLVAMQLSGCFAGINDYDIDEPTKMAAQVELKDLGVVIQ